MLRRGPGCSARRGARPVLDEPLAVGRESKDVVDGERDRSVRANSGAHPAARDQVAVTQWTEFDGKGQVREHISSLLDHLRQPLRPAYLAAGPVSDEVVGDDLGRDGPAVPQLDDPSV